MGGMLLPPLPSWFGLHSEILVMTIHKNLSCIDAIKKSLRTRLFWHSLIAIAGMIRPKNPSFRGLIHAINLASRADKTV